MNDHLAATDFFDLDSPEVRTLVRDATASATGEAEKAVRLFDAVRDGIRYDYRAISSDWRTLVASSVIRAGRSFCVGKAVALCAACRASAIPCMLGFADVRNHLAPPHLIEVMGTDVFVFHGFVQMMLKGRWVKATPAFDRDLCDRFGVCPIEFDGEHDALFHEYDLRGNLHMQYVADRGTFDDLPHDLMLAAFREAYPAIFDTGGHLSDDPDPDRR